MSNGQRLLRLAFGVVLLLGLGALGALFVQWNIDYDRLPPAPQPSKGRTVLIDLRRVAYGTPSDANRLALLPELAATLIPIGAAGFWICLSPEERKSGPHASLMGCGSTSKLWRAVKALSIIVFIAGFLMSFFLVTGVPPDLPSRPVVAASRESPIYVAGRLRFGTIGEQRCAKTLEWLPGAMLFGGMITLAALGLAEITGRNRG
jgi:hypothetical protein